MCQLNLSYTGGEGEFHHLFEMNFETKKIIMYIVHVLSRKCQNKGDSQNVRRQSFNLIVGKNCLTR